MYNLYKFNICKWTPWRWPKEISFEGLCDNILNFKLKCSCWCYLTIVCKFADRNNIKIIYHVAATCTTALSGCPEGHKLSKRSNCRVGFSDKSNYYKYHNNMTGRTEPQLSSQNIAGFSNISDFPSNRYKHKL